MQLEDAFRLQASDSFALAWQLRWNAPQARHRTTQEHCPVTCCADNCQFLQEMDMLQAQLAAVQDAQMTAAQHPMNSPLSAPFGSPTGQIKPTLSSVQVCTPTDTLPVVLASIPCYVSRDAHACCCGMLIDLHSLTLGGVDACT